MTKLNDYTRGIISVRMKNTPLSALAKEFRVSLSTIKRCAKMQAAKKAAPPVAKNTTLTDIVVKEALKMKRVNGLTIPKHPSSRSVSGELKQKQGISLSPRTVLRRLRNAGVRSYVRRKIPCRGAPSAAKRLALAKLFVSDPTHTVSTNDHSGRLQFARKRNDVLPRLRQRLQNTAARAMIWAAFGVGWRSELTYIPIKQVIDEDGRRKSTTINGASYIRKCLSPNIVALAKSKRVLQQDGAKPHTAKKTLAYLQRKGVRVLLNWPSGSPDCNKCEHLWPLMNRGIAERCPRNAQQLRDAAFATYNSIPQKVLDAIAGKGMRSKVKELLSRRGHA